MGICVQAQYFSITLLSHFQGRANQIQGGANAPPAPPPERNPALNIVAYRSLDVVCGPLNVVVYRNFCGPLNVVVCGPLNVVCADSSPLNVVYRPLNVVVGRCNDNVLPLPHNLFCHQTHKL